jgi:hypothetical protein
LVDEKQDLFHHPPSSIRNKICLIKERYQREIRFHEQPFGTTIKKYKPNLGKTHLEAQEQIIWGDCPWGVLIMLIDTVM